MGSCMKKHTLCIAALLCVASTVAPARAFREPVVGLLAVSGCAAGVYGIYKLFKYCTSDKYILEDAKSKYARYAAQYFPVQVRLQRFYGTSDERVLAKCFDVITRELSTRVDFASGYGLRSDISSLQQTQKGLDERIALMQHDVEKEPMVREMQTTRAEIHSLIKDLNKLDTFYQNNRPFFTLHATVSITEQEFHEHRENMFSRSQLKLVLKRTMNSLIRGAERVDSAIKNLKSGIIAEAERYPVLMENARSLHRDLIKIYDMIVEDPEYRQEVMAREWERVEQARVDAERERMRIECEKNKIHDERIKLERMKWERAEQARVERERMRIEREKVKMQEEQVKLERERWQREQEKMHEAAAREAAAQAAIDAAKKQQASVVPSSHLYPDLISSNPHDYQWMYGRWTYSPQPSAPPMD